MRPWEFACDPHLRDGILLRYGVASSDTEFVGNGVAFQLWDTYDNPVVTCPFPKALAVRSLYHGAMAYHRERKRGAAVRLDDIPEPLIPVDEQISDRVTELSAIISRIDGKRGEMLRWYVDEYLGDGVNWEDAVDRFGVTTGSARTLVFRARQTVQEMMLAH